MTLVRSPSGWAALVAGFALCLFVGYATTWLPGDFLTTPTSVYATVALSVALWPIVRRVLNGTIDVFEPILPASVMLASVFGVRPLVMLATGNRLLDERFSVASGFNRAVALGMIGTVSFVVGYELIFGARRRSASQWMGSKLNLPATRKAVRWLTGIGILLFFAQLARQGNPLSALSVLLHGRSTAVASVDATAYLADSPLLLACGATILIISLRGNLAEGQRFIVILLVLIPVLAFSLLGNRRFIIPSVAIPLVTYYLVRNRRPAWWRLGVIVPVVFVILATIPFARAAGARRVAGGALPIFTQAFEAPFKPVEKFFTANDTEMVPALALEIENLRHPSDYFFGRATVGDLLLAPVPSALFPKPQTSRNDLLIRIFGEPCGGGFCPDFSTVGTFYQDFWYVGAVVGMLLLGAFSALLWVRFRENAQSNMGLILAASWAVFLPIIIRAGFMPSFSWWLEFLFPLWLCMRAIEKRSSQSNAYFLERFRTGEIETSLDQA
jgi:hypothetical protein